MREGGEVPCEEVDPVVVCPVDQRLVISAQVAQCQPVAILGEANPEPLPGYLHLLLGAKAILLRIEVVGPSLCLGGHPAPVGVYETRTQHCARHVRTVGIIHLILLRVHPFAEIEVRCYVGIPYAYAYPLPGKPPSAKRYGQPKDIGPPKLTTAVVGGNSGRRL